MQWLHCVVAVLFVAETRQLRTHARQAEIVHDVAPGASIYFCSAFNGQSRFASCIDKLVAQGCKVIVDDVSYFGEGKARLCVRRRVA